MKLRRNYYHSRWKNVPTVRDFDFLFIFIGFGILAFFIYNKAKTIYIVKVIGILIGIIFYIYIVFKIYKKFQSQGKKNDNFLYNLSKESEYKNKHKNNMQCKECGFKMVLRTTKKGDNIGEQFYGCIGFPKCRHTEEK